jgi:Calcium-dependent channel, 7TM region, putative phosphate
VHDLGLRCSTAVVLFSFGLAFSVLTPLLTPVMFVLFLLAYYLDKYNLIFVYPIEFDSQVTNREALVKFSVLGIIYF